MREIPKTRRVLDELHLDYVRRQTCMMCNLPPLPLDRDNTLRRKRISDPHHIRNTRFPRRFFDWLTIPLCREHHNMMDTVRGRNWEKANRINIMRKVASMLYHDKRITRDQHDELWAARTEEEINAWIEEHTIR